MTSLPNVPAICPSASSIIRSAASHPPGPLGGVPQPLRYYQPTPTSRPPSRLASSPSLGTTSASPSFAPPEHGDAPRAWTISIAAPAPPLNGGEDEISQVPGRPLRTCPALRPRRTAAPQATTGTPMVPSAFTTTSAPPCANFGAPSRGLHALCVRFAAGVTPGQRNTRFRLVASLGRAGLSPAGSHRWFTVMSFRLHGVLHHQALPGAT